MRLLIKKYQYWFSVGLESKQTSLETTWLSHDSLQRCRVSNLRKWGRPATWSHSRLNQIRRGIFVRPIWHGTCWSRPELQYSSSLFSGPARSHPLLGAHSPSTNMEFILSMGILLAPNMLVHYMRSTTVSSEDDEALLDPTACLCYLCFAICSTTFEFDEHIVSHTYALASLLYNVFLIYFSSFLFRSRASTEKPFSCAS